MDLNRVTLLGRLTRDPELHTLPSGTSLTSFSVATGRQWEDKSGAKQKQTEFHKLVAWGKQAEIISQYLHKGSRVYIEGRLQTRVWTDSEKIKHYRTETVLNEIIMLDGRPASASPAAVQEEADDKPQEVVEEEVRVEAIPF